MFRMSWFWRWMRWRWLSVVRVRRWWGCCLRTRSSPGPRTSGRPGPRTLRRPGRWRHRAPDLRALGVPDPRASRLPDLRRRRRRNPSVPNPERPGPPTVRAQRARRVRWTFRAACDAERAARPTSALVARPLRNSGNAAARGPAAPGEKGQKKGTLSGPFFLYRSLVTLGS